jgi:hypothetical protein
MEKRASKLESKADKLDAKGKSGGSDLRSQASELREGAAALRSDGSDGKMANMLDGAAYEAAGGTPGGAAAVPRSDRDTMLVNRDNVDGFFGLKLAKWIVGHESLHTAGLDDQFGSNGKAAYKYGNPAQKEAFRELRGTPKALINPDHIMDVVY